MNFLFFGTSLALLEAELCPFKDWEEISNFSNSRVVWIIQKKGNSSEFNPRNYEQVKSSPSLQVLYQESVKDAVKFDKRVKLRVP